MGVVLPTRRLGVGARAEGTRVLSSAPSRRLAVEDLVFPRSRRPSYRRGRRGWTSPADPRTAPRAGGDGRPHHVILDAGTPRDEQRPPTGAIVVCAVRPVDESLVRRFFAACRSALGMSATTA